MSASGSVKVAVRVRPFNAREIEMNAKLCVKMEGPTTLLVEPESGQEKKFTFDHSYWSHDGFDAPPGGETVATDDRYATQRMVFNDLGRDVLNSAFDGYNSCLFAYGQTGSGKSYSMVGYGANKGIIPIVCEEMFKTIAENTDPTVKYQVIVSMLEIYNENVKDLLNPTHTPSGGLKIRSKPGIGVYVEDLMPCPVGSYAQIEAKMEEGTLNRTVASTKMNASSSRAHTVFTIIFNKKRTDMGLTSETQSRMNLVDLAGSERADSTGATGDRLKEGCAINASLSALGNVISALADLSSGKKKKVFVPYRNSALTRLLQDALGGNSRTIMICALSPADVNFDETLSTLRYADRAKQIKNKVFKMENPTDQLIAQLKAENARLMAMLEGKIPPSPSDGAGNGSEELGSLQQRLKEIEEEKAANERLLIEMQKSWEERLADAQKAAAEASSGAVTIKTAQSSDSAYIVNLHEDPQMTEKVVYLFNEGETKIGRPDAPVQQDVVHSGLNIRSQHALVEFNKTKRSLTIALAEPDAKVYVNGAPVASSSSLHHGDRLVLGNNFLFRVELPLSPTAPPILMDPAFQGAGAWGAAMTEFQQANGLISSSGGGGGGGVGSSGDRRGSGRSETEDAEVMKLRKQLEELTRERDEQKSQAALSPTSAAAAEAAEEMSSTAIKAIQEELKWKRRGKKLKQEVTSMTPLIYEANSLADEMDKDLSFDVKIVIASKQPPKANISMRTKPLGPRSQVWTWDVETFESRLFLMRELFNNVLEQGPQYILRENDPFWEPVQPEELGLAFVCLKALSQLVEVDGTFRVIDASGFPKGDIQAEIVPLGPDGKEMEYLSSPKEMLGMTVTFDIRTPFVTNVPASHANDLQLCFVFNGEPYTVHAAPVPPSSSRTVTATFPTTQRITVTVDEPFLNYLLTESVSFVLKGKPPSSSHELPADQIRVALKGTPAAIASRASVFMPAAPRGSMATMPSLPSTAAAAAVWSPESFTAAAANGAPCSQCQENVSTIWCAECERIYCSSCFPIMHKAARRKHHMPAPVAAAPADALASTSAAAASPEASPTAPAATGGAMAKCSKCLENDATVSCVECAVVYCDHCNAIMHKAASRREHTRNPLSMTTMCGLCKDNVATMKCAECDDVYCDNCVGIRHKAASRRDHVRVPL